jgi:hypothetical protein
MLGVYWAYDGRELRFWGSKISLLPLLLLVLELTRPQADLLGGSL